MSRSIHALIPFFRPFFSLGAQMGSQGPSRVPRRWFSGGLAIVFGNFLMHLGTRLQRKSTVAEQRGCALDTPRQSLAAGVLIHGYDQFLIIPTRGYPFPPPCPLKINFFLIQFQIPLFEGKWCQMGAQGGPQNPQKSEKIFKVPPKVPSGMLL